jgi:lipopolysaccharide export system permease protein
MIKLIDRQMVRGYFKSYLVCVTSLLSLYVVVDLFNNLDDFTRQKSGLTSVARHVVEYYAYRVPQIFDRLCEAIVLLAAMFTVALMQRNNEQVPLLSAGVSTRRIVAPVLLCAFCMLSLAALNQELLIPRIADKLVLARDDPEGDKVLMVRGGFEPNNIHLHGDHAVRKTLTIFKSFYCLIPEAVAGEQGQLHLQAEEAHYVKATETSPAGWELLGTQPAETVKPIPGILDVIDVDTTNHTGHFFLHVRKVDFDHLTRNPNWYQMAPTKKLYDDLNDPDSTRLASMAVLFHMRLTRPLLGMVLVVLGLSVILRDQNRNVIISSGMCLVLCGVFFAFSYACKTLGDNEYINPAFSAWLPVVTFGPFAFVLFDAVHT